MSLWEKILSRTYPVVVQYTSIISNMGWTEIANILALFV